MPHSSGGGSHGGGSHGGHSSHIGSHGGNSLPRTSRRYFTGARTFVYYRNHRPIYVYSDTDLRAKKPSIATAISSIIFCLIFVAILTSVIFVLVRPPKTLTNTSSYEIVIEDNKGVLGDTTALESTLSEFKEKTGITPAIITVDNSVWKTRYMDLEQYAYDLYVNKFSDETHWLIVYSETITGGFVDWYWEGMQGDDTDDILSESKLEVFNSDLQKYLMASTRYTTTQAFTTAFSSLNEVAMNNDIEWVPVIFIMFFDLMLVLAIVSTIKLTFFKGYKNEELCEINGDSKQNPNTTTCAYCGGVYVTELHNNCPHCGASIKIDK